ncbi:MAG: OmpA family protein [Scandinavium sp.]|uniref:OmpA family protein n=1 Tax=Scandinavium sp. TaxID=2830653 RepID=UPI003F392320
MRNLTKPLLVMLALVLALWLIWGFWPLGTGSRLFLSVVTLLLAGAAGWRFLKQMRQIASIVVDTALPPEDFEGALVLVCGDSDVVFPAKQAFRETRQGWYLPVRQPEQLAQVAESVASLRPALVAQVSIMLAVAPEHWLEQDAFASHLHQWQRAIAQSRRTFSGLPPVWISLWLNTPAKGDEDRYRWYLLTNNREGIQVQENNGVAQSYLPWCTYAPDALGTHRLDNSLWLESVFTWLKPNVTEILQAHHHDTPALPPCMLAVCSGPISASPENLWQQHVAGVTTLPTRLESDAEPPPLPDMLLPHLSRRHGVSRMMTAWRIAGALVGVFLLLAMCASWINNQRLIQNVSDHLTVFLRLSGTPPAPKVQAQEQLRKDNNLLDAWQRQGAPMRYTLGLYQGMRLIAPVRAALNSWAPPPPPPPVIKKIIQGPKTIRLDSMSLFDSGKYELKSGSTKLLINSLVGIKAKPGWLIVVAGHTDNTGNPQLNQTLSLKRAAAVRDWMRDTGDVPESCFAVQGYGESRPIATNDTTEGRALNRRVEISLVPQANACQLPGNTQASSQDDDVSQH